MGQSPGLRVVVVHNRDFADTSDPAYESRADVVNAARDVVRALTARGYRASTLGVGPRGPSDLFAAVDALAKEPPDLVFNLCESLAGDSRHEALLPGLLELSGITYTGSGPLALGLAVRKDLAKQLLRAHGVPTPEAVVVERASDAAAIALPFPLIVKPTREDASVGIDATSVVRDRAALEARVARVLDELAQPALVERFVEGRELYVSLLERVDSADGRLDREQGGPEALPMHEIDFDAMPAGKPRIVTYDGKWVPGSDEYAGTKSVRARPLDEATRARCEAAARAAFLALGLRDYARIDLRLAPDGTPWVIDVNPNCDVSDGAGVSRAASFGGLGYADLIDRICRAALRRAKEPLDAHAPRPGESDSVAIERPAAARPRRQATSGRRP